MAPPGRQKAKPTVQKAKGMPLRRKSDVPRVQLQGPAAKQHLAYAQSVLRAEAAAILELGDRLGLTFIRALELLLNCRGHVVVTGMGKPGFIAQKLSATLASTGIPSLYLHPGDAVHGDLGRVSAGDVVLALSNSGATEEIVRLLPALRKIGAQISALTGQVQSPLGRGADVVLDIGEIDEACPMGLVPTASSAALHAMGDALAMTLLKYRQFTPTDYALFHPGGKLGRAVMRVSDVMRKGDANPVVFEDARLSQVVVVMTNTPGRPGAALVVDREGRLSGIFTDGDLRRLVEHGRPNFDLKIKDAMGKHPRCVSPEELVLTASTQMRELKVDQLPVVDAEGRPVGLLDVQDLLAARVL